MYRSISPPRWKDEQLDSTAPSQPEESYFDQLLNAWVFSRFDDVVAAFRSSALCQAGPRNTLKADCPDDTVRLRMRAETAETLSPVKLAQWRNEMARLAAALLEQLPEREPVDLITEYAGPLCLHLATLVTCVSPSCSANLTELAQKISEAAAEPFNEELGRQAKKAGAALAPYFDSGPVSLRESGFVALSQTLRHMLARCWYTLLRYPSEWDRLHREPELIGPAVEELLRYAGLTRILFRIAIADVEINGKPIQKGQRIILRLAAANLDPAAFENPHSLDIAAQRKYHFSLGFGKHGCVGAPLIRLAVNTTTRLLVQRYASGELQEEIEWRGGSGFRYPGTLCVVLHRGAASLVARKAST